MLAAERPWPAEPKALATTSSTARSRSALGVTTIEFVPAVSAARCPLPAPGPEQPRALLAPVTSTRSTRAWDTRMRASSLVPRSPWSRSTTVTRPPGTPAPISASTRTVALRVGVPGGHQDHGASRGERGEHEVGGSGHRGTLEGGDHAEPCRHEPSVVHRVEFRGEGGIAARAVDRLAHLGVRLGEGDLCLAHHRFDQLAAAQLQLLADAVEDLRARRRPPLAPLVARRGRRGDAPFQVGSIRHPGIDHPGLPRARVRPAPGCPAPNAGSPRRTDCFAAFA